jgi:hypothetical protein
VVYYWNEIFPCSKNFTLSKSFTLSEGVTLNIIETFCHALAVQEWVGCMASQFICLAAEKWCSKHHNTIIVTINYWTSFMRLIRIINNMIINNISYYISYLYISIHTYIYIHHYITLSLMCGLWVLYHHQHHTSMAPSGTVASQVKVLRPGEDDSMQGKSDLAWFLSYPYWSCLTMFNLDIHKVSKTPQHYTQTTVV